MRAPANPAARCFKELTGREAFRLILGEILSRADGNPAAFTDTDMDRIAATVKQDRRQGVEFYDWWRVCTMIYHLSAEARRLAMEALWRLSVLFGKMGVEAHTPGEDGEFQAALKDIDWIPETVEPLLSDYARLRVLLEAFGELHGVDMTLLLRREHELLVTALTEYDRMARSINRAYAAQLPDAETMTEQEAENSLLPPLTLTPPNIPANLKTQLMATLQANYTAEKLWTVIMGAMDRRLHAV